MEEISRRGRKKVLTDFGYPVEITAPYRNLHSGKEESLQSLIAIDGFPIDARIDHDLLNILEHWRPAKGKNTIKPEYEAKRTLAEEIKKSEVKEQKKIDKGVKREGKEDVIEATEPEEKIRPVFGEKYQLTGYGKNIVDGISEALSKFTREQISQDEAIAIVRKYLSADEVGVGFASTIRTQTGHYAFGKYSRKMITFLDKPFASTPEHEVVHAYFDLFTTAERKLAVLKEVMNKNPGIGTFKQAQEQLADDFVFYARYGSKG